MFNEKAALGEHYPVTFLTGRLSMAICACGRNLASGKWYMMLCESNCEKQLARSRRQLQVSLILSRSKRRKSGCDPAPSHGARERAPSKGEVYGFDVGKQTKGRKRFILVDSLGLVMSLLVLEASCPERLGRVAVLHEACEEVKCSLERLWVDQGFSGENFARVVGQLAQAEGEVICRKSKEFEILPKRWIVERTFGWLNWYRRLSKDYECLVEMSEAMIQGAMIHTMLRRLAKLKQNGS